MKPYVETAETIEVHVYKHDGDDYSYYIYRAKDPYDALTWLCDTVSRCCGVEAYAIKEKEISPSSFYPNADENGMVDASDGEGHYS